MKRVFLTGAILFLVLIVTLAIFGIDPVQGLKLIAEGAFGDRFGVSRTLVRTSPLLLCGLGMTVAWKAGMYNIGGEGQYLAGGLFGAVAAQGLPANSLLILVSSIAGGAILASFAGWLQVKRGVQCVISTILLNFIVLQVVGWAVRGPIQEPNHQLPQSMDLPSRAMLHRFDSQTDLHVGVFVSLIVGVAVGMFLLATKAGFKLKLVGQNEEVARVNKIEPGRIQIAAMALSGGLCGLAGGLDYTGLVGHLGDGFAQGWGFLGIPVALLGGLNAIGVACASLFFGSLIAGGESLSRFNSTGTTLVYVIQALAVLGIVGLNSIKQKKVTPLD